jgi:hypothetical protein
MGISSRPALIASARLASTSALDPVLLGGCKVDDRIDAFSCHPELDRELHVRRAVRIDEGVNAAARSGANAIGDAGTVRHGNDAMAREPIAIRLARETDHRGSGVLPDWSRGEFRWQLPPSSFLKSSEAWRRTELSDEVMRACRRLVEEDAMQQHTEIKAVHETFEPAVPYDVFTARLEGLLGRFDHRVERVLAE